MMEWDGKIKESIICEDIGYPEYDGVEQYTWDEFICLIRDGIIIPGEDGSAIVHWYNK